MIIEHIQTCPKRRYQFELVPNVSVTLTVPIDDEMTFMDINDCIRDEWAGSYNEPDADSADFTEALDQLWVRYAPDVDLSAVYDPGAPPVSQSDLVAVFKVSWS